MFEKGQNFHSTETYFAHGIKTVRQENVIHQLKKILLQFKSNILEVWVKEKKAIVKTVENWITVWFVSEYAK